MPDPALAPIRVLAYSSDAEAWSVTLDDLPVSSGTAATAEDAAATAALVAVSCVLALRLVGLAARVEPTT